MTNTIVSAKWNEERTKFRENTRKVVGDAADSGGVYGDQLTSACFPLFVIGPRIARI